MRHNLHYEKFADGTIKCIEDEIPFDIPDNWAWCRLSLICPYGDCINVEPNKICENDWVLDLEDIEKDTGKVLQKVTKKERNSISTKHQFYAGQILYSKLRPYLNKVVLADADGYCTSEILPLDLHKSLLNKYIRYYLMSPTFLEYANNCSYGVKMPRLGTTDGLLAVIAIPPIDEQLKIANKVERIFNDIITLSNETDSFKSIISLLKSKILNLAIRGKLVPQNPDDEPASVLLERIKAEKEELIKQGKIKRDKSESTIFKGDDNSYYENVPTGWTICRLGEVAYFERGITFPSTAKELTPSLNNIACIRTANVQELLETDDLLYISKSYLKGNTNKFLRINDIIMSTANSRELVGKSCIVTRIDKEMTFGGFVLVIRAIDVLPAYLNLYLRDKFLKGEFAYKSTQTTNIANISTQDISNLQLWLPPIEEQQRIIDYVDELTKKIINVEASLN